MKTHKVISFVVLLFVCIVLPSVYASEIPIKKSILQNGLTVLISELPTSPTVSIYTLIKTGSATEGKFLGSGITHFLEHMLFKGTETRGAGEIASEIQALGGYINASTGKDYTVFTITVPYQEFDKALEIIADMFIHTKIDPVELEKERDVILSEMQLHNDNPDRRLSDLMYSTIYAMHPYKHPVIGYPSLFKKITLEDMVSYYHKMYVPNNMVLSVAGNIQADEVFPKIQEAFKGFFRGRDVVRNLVSEPLQISPRRFEQEYKTDLTRMSIAYSGVSLLDKDLYALDVLCRILGGGLSSRLYADIYKDRELVYQISSYNYTPVDRGFFQIGVLLENKNVEEVIERVALNIDEIKEKGVTEEELQKAKKQILSEFLFNRQKSSDVAYAQALDEGLVGDYLFSNHYVDLINEVSNEQIMDVAHKYLNESSRSIILIKPDSAIEEARPSEKSDIGKIKKIVLENGLTVLLRSDNTFPLVSMRVTAHGGTRNEPVEKIGLSKVVASTMTRGTKTLTSKDIDLKIESLGMDLDSYSGNNSFGIELDCLSDDLITAVSLFGDILNHPSFEEAEIKKIKSKMLAKIKQRYDSIFSYSSQKLKELLFVNHPYRYDSLGTFDSVDAISRDDIVAFYKKYTSPNNMVISVFGDIDIPQTLNLIKKQFGPLKKKNIEFPVFDEPVVESQRTKDLQMAKEQTLVIMGFHGTTFLDPDRYPLEVLSSILGSSFNGRLFRNIRETLGQAYSLGGGSIPGIDMGFVYFFALTKKGSAAEVQAIMEKEIEKVQKDLVSDEELKDIKSYLKGEFTSALETNSALNFTASLDELYGLGYENYLDYNAKIDAVTKEDILRVAQKYLQIKRSAVIVTNR